MNGLSRGTTIAFDAPNRGWAIGAMWGYVAGGLTSVLLLAIVPSWLAYLYWRSNRVASVVCLVLCGFLLVGQVAQRAEADSARSVNNAKTAEVERLAAAAHQEVERAALDFERAVEAFDRSGGTNVGTLKTLPELERRVELLNAVDAQLIRLDFLLRNGEPKLRAELKELGVGDAQANAWMRQLFPAKHMAVVFQIREQDRRFVNAARELFDLVRAEAGKMRIEEDGAAIAFESAEADRRFRVICGTIDDVIEKQQRLHRAAAAD